jgi:hypothetical protein
MKSKSLKSIIIVATLVAGCSKESKVNEAALTTTTNGGGAITNSSAAQKSLPTSTISSTATTVPAQPGPPPAPKKKFEEMTALEVAQNTTEYGFEKLAEMNNGTMSGRESYNADLTMVAGVNKQYVKKTSDGKPLILTVHYENGQPSFARWGGF